MLSLPATIGLYANTSANPAVLMTVALLVVSPSDVSARIAACLLFQFLLRFP